MIVTKGEKISYVGKRFSILGDSISTLAGYVPDGYAVFYAGEVCRRSGVCRMEDTWWGKVIRYFDGELLVNNSWSGSQAAKLWNCETQFPSGCSRERTGGLHIGQTMPDVIIIYLGTNDWARGVSMMHDPSNMPEQYKSACFADAYWEMLHRLRHNYPESEIWCCTLSETYMSSCPEFHFPHAYAGIHIESYNEIIRALARENQCKIIDLYHQHMPYDSIDGTHPSSAGMDTIAAAVIREAGNKVMLKLEDMGWGDEDELFGQKLKDKYVLYQLMERDALSRTYMAQDVSGHKWTVRIWEKASSAFDEDRRTAIMQEAYMLMRFDHPAIPKVADIIEDENYISVVREYIEGSTLYELLKKNGPFTEDEVRYYGQRLAAVLLYMHKFDPPHIYRNMKPMSVLITSSGDVKLMDFELIDFDLTREAQRNEENGITEVYRMPGYTAPEQFAGEYDPRTDIYSLGITMNQLITGISPIEPPYQMYPVRLVKPEISRGMEYIIQKCIAPDPDDRYQNCEELMLDLNNIRNLPQKKGLFSCLFGKKNKKHVNTTLPIN